MSALVDQAERDRFVTVPSKNISVIAPAGVGKTRSIVERIVHLARQPGGEEILPRLIVVTYSVRAAQEMQQRTRAAIREAKVSIRVQRAFQQTFFGTIHSYCVRLLNRFGHYLGLPMPVALLEADDEWWNRFLVHGLGHEGPFDENLRQLFHFYSPEKLYALGKEISPGAELKVAPLPFPAVGRLLDYRDEDLHAATKKSIVRAQDAVRQWSEAYARGDRFRPMPKCPESEKAAAFAEIWSETFAPMHEWLRNAALAFGRNVANAYERFRLSEAVMTYDDQVRMALRVLDDPAVRRELGSERLSVLLDEAQDTDPRQFEVLRRIVGFGSDPNQTEDQSFCIVGDFQQAIYAPRSDLAVYRRVHDEISSKPRGTSSVLSVTFRCDGAIIDFVNRIFPAGLNDADGQCAFVKLIPREKAGPGNVVRWHCPDAPEETPLTADLRSRHEARFMAQKMKEAGPAGLGASDWSQVAVLCPRKNWLLDLQRELVAVGLPVQLHSSNEQQRDRTPTTWLTALLWVAVHPEDSFEIAGVLREIFGVSDHDMALFTGGDGDKLRLDRLLPENAGAVEVALKILREACADAETLPPHRFLRQMLEKTRLRERMNSIPAMKLENADRELDDFLASILGRCAEGTMLADLAHELRQGLAQVHSVEEEIRDAIQLLTSHKAKGLEWQTVIVPYVFRAIESKAVPYPRLVQVGEGREVICRDKADFAAQAQSYVTRREKQQLQRLLYVMSTRAKQTLLLIDDESLFAGQKRRNGWSAGELLGFLSGVNRETWMQLPEATGDLGFASCAPRSPGQQSSPGPRDATERSPDLSPEDLRSAIAHAQAFPRRMTPHTLAAHPPAEVEPEKQIEQEEGQSVVVTGNPGILYGTWWHEFVQTIPWQQPVAAWQKKFIEAQSRSPQPERSTREWNLFRRSELAKWLAGPGRLIQVEIPFLWRETGCLEGVMDLAVYTGSEAEWCVIDWKTNRVDADGSARLVEVYREQIRAYVRALREMLSADARGSLYLTQTGEWVKVE